MDNFEVREFAAYSANCFYRIEYILDSHGKHPPVLLGNYGFRINENIKKLLISPCMLYKYLNYPQDKIKTYYSDEKDVFEYIYAEFLASTMIQIVLLVNGKEKINFNTININGGVYEYIENLLLNGVKFSLPKETTELLARKSIEYLGKGFRSDCNKFIYLFCLLFCKNKYYAEKIDSYLIKMIDIDKIYKFKYKGILNYEYMY
jgi:hypothetical protein